MNGMTPLGEQEGNRHYTNKGKIPGVSGPVDLSHAYKDCPAIIQRTGLSRMKEV